MQVDPDLPIKLSLDESNILYFSNLVAKQEKFEAELAACTADHKVIYSQLNEDNINMAVGEEKKIPILRAKWQLLGQYGFDNSAKHYFWEWAWHLVEDDTHYEKLREIISKLPEDVIPLTHANIIMFSDATLISYLQGFICDTAPYEYIKLFEVQHDVYAMMALYDIEWFDQIIEPDYDTISD